METKELKSAAVELNEVLGIEPKLVFDGDVDTFKKNILKVSKLIEPEDKISGETMNVINSLKGIKTKKKVKEKPKEEKKKKVKEKPKEEKKKKVKEKPKEEKKKKVKKEPEFINQENLIVAAKNLQKTLGIEPKINTKKATVEELKKWFLTASTLVKPSDKIKLITKHVVDYFLSSGKRKAPHKLDEYGYRIGSKKNLFIESLLKKPKTMIEMRHEPWNANNCTFYDFYNELKKKGLVDRNPEGKMFMKTSKKKAKK